MKYGIKCIRPDLSLMSEVALILGDWVHTIRGYETWLLTETTHLIIEFANLDELTTEVSELNAMITKMGLDATLNYCTVEALP